MLQDLAALAELQGQLFKSDAREVTEQIARPMAFFAAGMLLAAATLPVCLLALAEGLVAAGVPRAGAYAIVAVGALVVAAGLTLWAWRRFRRIPPAFTRSREELMQNIAWIKDAARGRTAQREQAASELRNSCSY
jgi:hypothetical protein